jgi:hypothetical protein
MAEDTEPRPASGTPAWPDPYPSGPYASVPYPAGPYSSGLSSPAPTVPLPGQGAAGPAPTVPLSGAPVSFPADPTAPTIAQIGDIRVTSTSVFTPVGDFALRGSRWEVQDQWMSAQKTPTWAVVCAVVGFFIVTVFSLFFLLAKKTVYSGVVQVTVTNGLYRYDARMPVIDQAQVQHVHTQVNYVRSLAAL